MNRKLQQRLLKEPAIRESLLWASGYLVCNTDACNIDISSARLDAEVILANLLGKDRGYLFAWPEKLLSQHQWMAFSECIRARSLGKPVAYITGRQEFWSLSLNVTEATLIPRPDTEALVGYVLDKHAGTEYLQLLDAGTGSGAIALAIVSEKPRWNINACDISRDALHVAKENAVTHGLSVRFFQSNWLAGIKPGSYDIVVSNPPYICEGDEHLRALSYEPQTALVAGDDGLADIKVIARQARSVLRAGGALYVEHGYNQGERVMAILQANGFQHVACEKDYAGNDRFTHGIKVQESDDE